MFKKFALNRIKKMANKRLENAEKNENESVAADAAVGEEEKTEDVSFILFLNKYLLLQRLNQNLI